MRCIVIKQFQAADQLLRPGDVVDASKFRLCDKLIAQRFLRPMTEPKRGGKAKTSAVVDDDTASSSAAPAGNGGQTENTQP